MDNLATYILNIVLIGLGVAFVKFGGAIYLKTLLKDRVVHIMVYAVEQKIKGSGMGATKKAEVIAKLEALKIKVDDTVDCMIEASVAEINLLTKNAITKITK